MKKWIAIVLALTLAISLPACSCAQTPEETTPTDPTDTNPTATADTNPTVATDPTQPAATGKTLSGSMADNIEKLVAKNPPEFMGGVMPLDLQDTSEDGVLALEGYTGLSAATPLADGAVYEPMMGSLAFSLVLVRVANAADAQSVARQMKDNINPRKWICVQADQVMAAGYGDVIMFIMLDSAATGKTAQSYVDAFTALCGSAPDFTL